MRESEPLTGEPLALDLVNTRPVGQEGRTDLISTPDRLAAWLALEADRLPADIRDGVRDDIRDGVRDRACVGARDGSRDDVPTPADLAAVHAVRAHTEAAVRALLDGSAPPPAALRGLTEAQRAAPSTRELAWDGAAVTASPRRAGPLGARLAALFAEAAADLLAGPAGGKIKECEADDCVMLFLPTHPRRRWCSPARCGNRARVARYYQRHKSADTAEG